MSIDKCFITDQPIEIIRDDYDDNFYRVNYAGQTFTFGFSMDHRNTDFVEENKYILKGLMINKKFPITKQVIFNNERLETIINEANIPRTPKEKRDNLLIFLNSLQKYEGEMFDFDDQQELFLLKLYFKNQREYFFYMSLLKEQGLINFLETSNKGGDGAIHVTMTYRGLLEVISLQEEGKLSNNCFVAMWFDPLMKPVRDSIKEAIIECGFSPVLVDEIHFDSIVTINDAIISNLKKSKFVIADFSGQRPGVYFEAGFALGQGKQVVYLCQEDKFGECHFDTNHYPHVLYKDHDDLKEKLINRIQAWID